MCTHSEGEVVDDGETGGTPVLPLVLPWTEVEGNEGELSDLDPDIEEYIASASEVCFVINPACYHIQVQCVSTL